MPAVPQRIRIKETGQTFVSARVLAKFIDGDFATIYACLRGERKYHKGYSYEYVKEDDHGTVDTRSPAQFD